MSPADAGQPGALAGVRILSFTTGIAGPRAGRILAQAGARVIKVESRNGGIDAFRYFGTRGREGGEADDWLNSSPRFVEVNSGVESVSIDLKHPDGLGVARALAAHCDVVLDNFRPTVLDKLGLGFADLREFNPRIICVKASGMGLTGPRSALGTWGPTVAAYGGLTYLWNHPGQREPVGSQSVYPDYASSIAIAMVTVAGLLRRERTGAGCLIDVAQSEIVTYALGMSFLSATLNGADPEPLGNASPAHVPASVYPCRGKNRWCAISVIDDSHWLALCDALDDQELAADPQLKTAAGRGRERELIDARIGRWTSSRTVEEVVSVLARHGIAVGAVASNDDLYKDSRLRAGGFIQEVDQPGLGRIPFANIPITSAAGAFLPPRAAPRIGEHNRQVLRDVGGFDDADIDRLEDTRAIY